MNPASSELRVCAFCKKENRHRHNICEYCNRSLGKQQQLREDRMSDTVTCMDCRKPYCDFPMDVVLSDEQWSKLSGRKDGSGILCAACIVERAAKLPEITVCKMVLE